MRSLLPLLSLTLGCLVVPLLRATDAHPPEPVAASSQPEPEAAEKGAHEPADAAGEHAEPSSSHKDIADAKAAAEEHARVGTEPAHAGHDQPGEAHGAPGGSTEYGLRDTQAEGLMKYAHKAYEDGRFDTAAIAYRQLLGYPLSRQQEREVLTGFAKTLRKKGELTKAVAVYEKLLKEYPLGTDAPEIYLELGRALRALGSHKLAISRFYSVINSTIKLPEDGAEAYRRLAKTAQFEIAETYFAAGNYTEASRFYSRLRLLDLAPVDRARAHFKAAYSLHLAEDFQSAINQLRAFIDLNPQDENVPEAHYLLAVSYRKLQRPLEALVESLELLRTEKSKTQKDPKRWAYWQRKTGNQIANEFYEQGDTGNALTIYQTLVELSPEPTWRLPVLYQIALCQERLSHREKAIEAYQHIVEAVNTLKSGDQVPNDLGDLQRMALWRLNQIGWEGSVGNRVESLVAKPPQAPSPPPQPNPETNDAGGNPATTPAPVR